MKQIINNINPDSFTDDEILQVYDILINHFEYSIKDINSYDELTNEEKEFIPRDLFNRITE